MITLYILYIIYIYIYCKNTIIIYLYIYIYIYLYIYIYIYISRWLLCFRQLYKIHNLIYNSIHIKTNNDNIIYILFNIS